jgi:hypothetical protein
MDTNKAAYWIALGVLALGLNSEYRQGNFVALHRAAERAGSVLCQISTRAEQTVALALGITGRDEFAADSLLAVNDGAEMARTEAEMVREQAREHAEMVRERVRDEIRARADEIREQAEMQRAQIEQIRWRTASQVRMVRTVNRRVTVVCPKTGTRISVNPVGDLAEISPDVEVDDTF